MTELWTDIVTTEEFADEYYDVPMARGRANSKNLIMRVYPNLLADYRNPRVRFVVKGEGSSLLLSTAFLSYAVSVYNEQT